MSTDNVDPDIAEAAILVSIEDNQPAHPFSFFGRPAGKILWTNGNLRLTASAGVTRNSASREDSDHKVSRPRSQIGNEVLAEIEIASE